MFYGEAAGNPANKTLAQRGINAKRAAVVIAQRALTEYLEGIVLVGATLVKDSVLQNDVIVSTGYWLCQRKPGCASGIQ